MNRGGCQKASMISKVLLSAYPNISSAGPSRMTPVDVKVLIENKVAV